MPLIGESLDFTFYLNRTVLYTCEEILTKDLTSKILMVSNATSVSFKDAGSGLHSSRKRSMTYIVVKKEKLVEEKLLPPQVTQAKK